MYYIKYKRILITIGKSQRGYLARSQFRGHTLQKNFSTSQDQIVSKRMNDNDEQNWQTTMKLLPYPGSSIIQKY